jgi:hypothetical protein
VPFVHRISDRKVDFVPAIRQAAAIGDDERIADDALGSLVMTFSIGVHRRFSSFLASGQSRSRMREKG